MAMPPSALTSPIMSNMGVRTSSPFVWMQRSMKDGITKGQEFTAILGLEKPTLCTSPNGGPSFGANLPAMAHISIATQIINESGEKRTARVSSIVLDTDGKLVATVPTKEFEIAADDTLIVDARVDLDHAALWSLEEPNLYRVVSQLQSGGKVTDHDSATFGIRSIRFDPDHGFFLNGKPVKIKGTCVHQDHAGVGIAVPDRIHYERVAALKAMGANGCRTAHNQAAPR